MGSCGAGLSMVKHGWVREAWAGGMLEYLWGGIELGKPHVMVASKRVVILGLQHPISKKKPNIIKALWWLTSILGAVHVLQKPQLALFLPLLLICSVTSGKSFNPNFNLFYGDVARLN